MCKLSEKSDKNEFYRVYMQTNWTNSLGISCRGFFIISLHTCVLELESSRAAIWWSLAQFIYTRALFLFSRFKASTRFHNVFSLLGLHAHPFTNCVFRRHKLSPEFTSNPLEYTYICTYYWIEGFALCFFSFFRKRPEFLGSRLNKTYWKSLISLGMFFSFL